MGNIDIIITSVKGHIYPIGHHIYFCGWIGMAEAGKKGLSPEQETVLGDNSRVRL